MINGIQKYLMIALSAVFLWVPPSTVHAQDIETIILPMEEISLHYKGDAFLLTRAQAKDLDTVAQHMRSKPEIRIVASHTANTSSKLIQKRFKIIKAYMRDIGIGNDQIIFKSAKDKTCLADCVGTIILTEFSDS